MIDPVTDEWYDVLDASTDPDVLSHTQYGAVTGESYKFRVFAVNFNGRSTLVGNTVEILTCGLPLHFAQPTYVTSSRTSITIEWAPPYEDGGCQIYDYAIFIDADGSGTGPWTEVNPLRRNDPTLDEFESDTFPAGAALGDHFVFKIIATNRQGSIESLLSAPLIYAGVPAAPAAAPISDPDVTSW